MLVVKKHNEEMVARATVDVKGKEPSSKKPSSKKTNKSGISKFKPIDHDTYNIDVTLPTSLANDFEKPKTGYTPVPEASTVLHTVYIEGIAPLKVIVRRSDKKNEFIEGASIEVKVAEAGGLQGEKTTDNKGTDNKGTAVFPKLKANTYTVTLTLSEQDKAKYKIDNSADQNYTLDLNKKENKVEFKVTPFLRVYLKLLFTDPENNKRVLPEKIPLRLVPESSGTPIKAEVRENGVVYSDDHPWVEVLRSAKSFTLDFKQDKENNIVCEKRNAAKTQELVAETDLAAKITAGHRVFRLPTGNWTLKNSDWEPEGSIPAYKKNQYKFADLDNMGTTIGSSKDNPARLLLNPHWQFYRFEYFDRCFGHSDHGDKRISIPSIMLKGVRKCPGGSSANYDAISNWTTGNDDKQLLQCLPWIISKKDDGSALGKLDKDMLLEFGQENTFVFSKSATEREIQKLDPSGTDKDKLKPGPNRPKYYDLPRLWKSKNYYTRLSGGSGKFFDELTEADIEAANDSTKPLAFSLDDVVLVDNSGNQIAKDQDKDGNANKDFSEHSRLTLLYMDPDDKFKVKIYEPRVKAAYHTKAEFSFAKDAAGKYRNAIVNCDPKIRAVVFCRDFHDIYNKRTETADFTKKQILGARASKINDEDIHVTKTLKHTGYTDDNNKKAYIFGIGNYEIHYLHFGGVKDGSVYGALITYWSARFFNTDHAGTVTALNVGYTADEFFKDEDSGNRYPGSVADKKNYLEKGMKNAMDRWNTKDYQLEQTDDGKNVIIKTFCLFEAKEFEDPSTPNTFIQQGGKHSCLVVIVTDDIGSWASTNGKVMRMRKSAFADEGNGWGAPPGDPNLRDKDYDGDPGPARLVLAHELGHQSVGLSDEYIYDIDDADGLTRYEQYYPGMPYVIDKCTLMNQNQAIRMHHYWGRTNWVNDEARATKSLNPFLNAKKFKITYKPDAKDKLEFDLIDPNDEDYFDHTKSKYRDIYKPAYKKESFNLGYKSKCDLFMYKLGNGEFTNLLKNGPYKGIVVIRTRMSAKFKEGAITTWEAGKKYDLNDTVKNGVEYYYCKTAHDPSSDAFATDAAKWGEVTNENDWKPATLYNAGKMVTYSGTYYRCKTNHTSSGFDSGSTTDSDKWIELDDKGAWSQATNYMEVNLVTNGGKNYACSANNITGPFDASKWIELEDKGAWASNITYSWSNLVTKSGKKYFCKGSHTSVSHTTDKDKWEPIHPKASWTQTQKKQWLAKLNDKIEAMTKDKFKITCDDEHDFSNTYIRFFTQFEFKNPDQTATDGTNMELEITRDGANTFNPKDQKISAGENSNYNTIIRYLYGCLSDDATIRNTQNKTDPLAKNDLSELESWMDVDGDGIWFEVKDI